MNRMQESGTPMVCAIVCVRASQHCSLLVDARYLFIYKILQLLICILYLKMVVPARRLPNILVTGTPGVGKSTICKRLEQATQLTWREVSKLAIELNCIDEFDPEYQCPFLNEDKLMDHMESMMTKGGNIVEYHGCDFFPERWFDGIFVVRANNTVLYDRLTARGYTGRKLEDNIQCEIFETVLEEALSSYRTELVTELQNDDNEQLHTNVNEIIDWIETWKEEHLGH